MAETQKVLGEELGTSSSSTEEEMSKSELMEATPETPDTSTGSLQKRRTVPSSQIEGSVWLRYAPKEEAADGFELPTQT